MRQGSCHNLLFRYYYACFASFKLSVANAQAESGFEEDSDWEYYELNDLPENNVSNDEALQ